MCWPAKQQTVFLTSRSTAAGQGIQHVRVRVRTSGSYRVVRDYTSSTALMHPSFSGLFVTCAYLPHTTLPDGVTSPRSAQLTSMIVPLVMTPSDVYSGDCGFFLTPADGRGHG